MKLGKVTMVTDHHLESGIGRYSYELAKKMGDFDHTQLYKPFKKTHPDAYVHLDHTWVRKIQYRSFRNLHPYILPWFIAAKVLPQKSDIYHAHWFMAALGLLIAKKKNIVVTMHDVSLLHVLEADAQFTNYYRKVIDQLKKREVPIVVVSKSAKRDAVEYANYPDHLVYVVYNGINHDMFHVDKAAEKKKSDGPFKLIYSGGLGNRKNLPLLLKAFKIIEDRNQDVVLEVAGAYPENTTYPKLAKELKLKNIDFVGFVPEKEITNFYRSADLHVFTSDYEGFGFGPLEAMACGTPSVSTKGGSLEEVLTGGSALVDSDPEAIASAVLRYMEDTDYYETQIEKGIAHSAKYNWTQCARNTARVYETIT